MIEDVKLNNDWNLFLTSIVASIQIQLDEFMVRVANKECYEMMIHEWAIRLFEKGVPNERAISIIHRTRRFVLIYKTKGYYPTAPMLTIASVPDILNKYPKYNLLNEDSKLLVKSKVSKMLFKNYTHLEVIEEVLNTINPHLVNKKENYPVFISVIQNRIIGLIRKSNFIQYWKNG